MVPGLALGLVLGLRFMPEPHGTGASVVSNLLMLIPALVGGVASVSAIAYAFRRGSAIEALPSIAWLLLAIVPFVYLTAYFRPETASQQAWGVMAFALAFAIGDAFSASRPHLRGAGLAPTSIGTLICWLLAAVVVILPIINIALAHGLPILERLSGDLTPEESAMARERFSKLLDAPVLLKLAFNWVIVIASPILAAILFNRRRWWLFSMVVLWCSIYAVVSGARLPLIMFVLFTSIAILKGFRSTLSNLATGAMAAGLLVIVCAGVYRGEVLYTWYEQLDWDLVPESFTADLQQRLAATPIQMSPADVERIGLPNGDQQKPGTWTDTGDYAAYRAVLSPMEVSNRWYEYYPAVEGWRPLADLLPTSKPEGWRHASNKVGIWAYVQRFPNSFFDTIHAYASADADAYSFGGLPSVFLAALILGLTRILLGFLASRGEVETVLSGLGIAFLTALPFQASVQAILVPQGLVLVVAAAIALAAIGPGDGITRFFGIRPSVLDAGRDR